MSAPPCPTASAPPVRTARVRTAGADDADFVPTEAQPPQRAGSDGARANGVLAERVDALESEVASLRADLDELRDLLTEPATH